MTYVLNADVIIFLLQKKYVSGMDTNYRKRIKKSIILLITDFMKKNLFPMK